MFLSVLVDGHLNFAVFVSALKSNATNDPKVAMSFLLIAIAPFSAYTNPA